jgi:hypothetical protein
MTDHAGLLIHLKLKGFVRGATADFVALIADGLAEEGKLGVKLTEAGKAAAADAWAGERAQANASAMEAVYHAFDPVNAGFKALVGRWQLRDGGVNDHSDAAYDAAVLADLDGVHADILPLIADAAGEVPRLANYADRLTAAKALVSDGQTRWFAAPIIDSYHTLWFELHEELIQLTGRSRAAEAAAGRAA